MASNKNAYFALCYHYIRENKDNEQFCNILGNSKHEFLEHVKMLNKYFHMLSPEQVYKFHYSNYSNRANKYGILLTFDDGLSDHYLAAQILVDYGIKAIFFIPSCILKDEMPANPTIIHYCLARYKISGFLKKYMEALEDFGLDIDSYRIRFNKGKDNPFLTIAKIKRIFKYKLAHNLSRDILMHIYRNTLLKDHDNAFQIMHLTRKQFTDIVDMGHSIGVHSHSHISVAASDLNEKDFENEIIMPKRYIGNIINKSINYFSYPFGEKKDCLTSNELINRTKEYDLVFTVEEKLNTKETSPFELGRCTPYGSDTAEILKKKLYSILNKS